MAASADKQGTTPANRLVLAISSRTLFDLEDAHELYVRDGLAAYLDYQRSREDEVLSPGAAFPLVRKLLALQGPDGSQSVEVILLSRNSSETGLRIFNSIQHHGLAISRAVFSNGAAPFPYIQPFGAHLFLSTHGEDVRSALKAGVAAATVLPVPALESRHDQLRIAFDGDAVLFGDESERIARGEGLLAFSKNEKDLALTPLSVGPFGAFLHALHDLQQEYPVDEAPIRTALVTARSAPAHKRVILTLREWGVRLDEALFLGGRDKGPFLDAFGADIFFDDSTHNIESARRHVAAGHVPHGVSNEG
jgi:5'-nucleotidase